MPPRKTQSISKPDSAPSVRSANLTALGHTQVVAFCVLEPGRLVRPEHAHVVDRLQIGEVIILEHHPAPLQIGDDLLDSADLEAQCGVLSLGTFRLGDEGDLSIAAAGKQAANPLGSNPSVFS